LFEDSKEYISSKLCSIYALEIDNYIRWYISFSASVIKMQEKYFRCFLWWKVNDLEWVWFPIPWLLVWKLLIDKELRGNGYWKSLLNFAISTAYELSKTIWIRFIIVDANNNALGFYEKNWFIPIEKNSNNTKMLFDLKELDDL
jgi:GNAT superfamily N-acetyltransferase